MSTATADRFEAPQSSAGERMRKALLGSAPIFLVLAVLIVLIVIENPNFTEPPVFLAFLKRAAPLVILAAGQYFVIVAGEFDLSVGSLVTVVVVVAARLIDGDPGNTWPVIALCLAIGAAVGVVNGVITTRLRVPSFITTLGMLLILSGAVFLWTNGAPRGALADNFREIGRLGINDFPVLEQLPYSVIIMLVLGAGAIVLMRAGWGRRLLAVGDNEQAARLSGVRVENMRTVAFILSGLSAAIAGILLGGFAGVSAQVGEGLEFEAITAVVLGGVALGGGRGTVLAAMAGALTLEALFTLLNLWGVSGAWEDTVQGGIIIVAVAFASYRMRGAR
jgi:ribose transport system permease protein